MEIKIGLKVKDLQTKRCRRASSRNLVSRKIPHSPLWRSRLPFGLERFLFDTYDIQIRHATEKCSTKNKNLNSIFYLKKWLKVLIKNCIWAIIPVLNTGTIRLVLTFTTVRRTKRPFFNLFFLQQLLSL